MQIDKPILELFTRLGKTETEKVTVCYFGPKNSWTSKRLPLTNADIFAQTLTANGMNVYTMVNSVDDRELTSSNTRGDINDITRLNALWADLDYKDSGISNEENARAVIDSISSIIGVNPCAIVMSGHGLQPYWAVEDGQIDDYNRSHVAGISRRFGMLIQKVAELYGGKVDNVSDLPRVLRAPGTINHKDAENPVEVKVEFNDHTYPIELSQVIEALDAHGILSSDENVSESVVISKPEEWRVAQEDCAWTHQLIDTIHKSNPKARHPWLVANAIKIYSSVRYGCFTEEGYTNAAKVLEEKFTSLLTTGEKRQPHPGEVQTAFRWAKQMVSTYSDAKLSSEVRNHVHKLHLSIVPDIPLGQTHQMDGNLALSPAPISLPIDAFKYTDLANAERLAYAAKGKYIFVPDLGWFKWENSVYVPDNARTIERLAGESALTFGAIDGTKAGMDWARKSLSRAAITNSVLLSQTVPEIVIMPHELDGNPLELCTPNGIISLETGILRDADPLDDYNTMQTAISPKHQKTPMWDDFLNMVITEKERIDYIQELLGVALVGEVRWHILPVFVGVGANGKSTLLEVASKILGNYSRTMPENFLLDTNSQQHSTEIANLRGVRFAVASETRPDGKFNESRIKMLTGGDTISARKLYKDFFDFSPSHTLFLALNHLPSVRSGGAGFWRRLRKIDFKYQVPIEKQRQGLADDIVNQEGPGILSWMIEGAMRVIANGITEPKSVQIATNEYRGEEDHISRFVEEMIVESPMFTTNSEALLRGYRTWCNENGETPLATTPFIRELRMRVPMNPVRRTGGTRAYSGIGFYNPEISGGSYYGD